VRNSHVVVLPPRARGEWNFVSSISNFIRFLYDIRGAIGIDNGECIRILVEI
jgi:hypothetical protein